MARINTRLTVAALTVLAAVMSLARAQEPAYDCGSITVDGASYDISVFKPTTFVVKGEPIDEHPNKLRIDYQVNPCQAIAIPDGEAQKHCKAGAWVCQDTELVKEGSEDQVLFLRTIAGSSPATDNTPARDVAPSVVRAEQMMNVKELPWNLTLKGGSIGGFDQSAVITFICDMAITDEKVGPALTSYDKGVAKFTWKTSHACPKQVENPVSEGGMSGFGVFLRVVAIIAAFYLIAGMAYNHYMYGAKGMDMIPNIDFWRDFPYLVTSVVRHVWDAATGRSSSRGGTGYVSV
ncbi:autophagy-related protein 27 [Mortierella sp. GBAus27b]|nr:hypothetical protein BGX31_006272 [Mortierella sp. GBA43]KAI8345495.1 autophagy-related protein 27 [Mortierella sp. GBAus27b]